jgi:hypothetical protein
MALVSAPASSPLGAAPDLLLGLSPESPIAIDSTSGEVRLLAELQAKSFAGRAFSRMAGYHALVWKKGGSKREALLTSYVDDRTLHAALITIGAIPGNNLTQEVWDEREEMANPAADMRIEGTPMEMLVWWPGLETAVSIESLLVDPGGRGVDLRFGGNLDLADRWRSGCIVCLYSCPGSKVGNRAYTVRDWTQGTTEFSVNWELVPEKKSAAVVVFRIREQ